MKNIIEELWNGEINPQDTLVDNNPHYKELQHLQSRNKAELLEGLSEEQKEKRLFVNSWGRKNLTKV